MIKYVRIHDDSGGNMKKNKLLLTSGVMLTISGGLSIFVSMLYGLMYILALSLNGYGAFINNGSASSCTVFGICLLTFGIMLLSTKQENLNRSRGFIITVQVLAYVFGGLMVVLEYVLCGLCAIAGAILLSVYISKTSNKSISVTPHTTNMSSTGDVKMDKIMAVYNLYEKGFLKKTEMEQMVASIRGEEKVDKNVATNEAMVETKTTADVETKENVETNKDIKETNTQNKEEGKDEN